MKKKTLRLISVMLIVLTLCSCFAVTSFAVMAEKGSFWDAFARGVSPLYGFLSAYLEDGKTPETAMDEDWKRAYGGSFGDGSGGFGGYVGNVQETLGTTQIGKDGVMYLPLYFEDLPSGVFTANDEKTIADVASSYVSNIGRNYSVSFALSADQPYYYMCCLSYFYCPQSGSFPVDLMDMAARDSYVDVSSASFYYGSTFHQGKTAPYSEKGQGYYYRYGEIGPNVYKVGAYTFSASGCVPFVPDALDSESEQLIVLDTRAGAFSGDFGYTGDNGQMIVGENIKLVDETNNKVYNPVTNTTTNITDWTYDYSNRSYTATTDAGDTIIITYGDENVTYVEGDTTYNIYYVTNGGGSGGGTDPVDPETCKHNYVSTITTEPTCLTAGSKTLTCSKCGDTKTEKIPATGHIWVVSRSVQTSYDDQGNMVQQGYTIYKCSVCGEEYKDITGTGPPGSGGEEEKESFWDKVKNFFSELTGGIFDAIVTVLGAIIDGFTKIVEKINEKIGIVIDTALKIFNKIPDLFKGFIDFLTAGFAFLPEEVVMIIEFGLLAVIAVAIIKIFIR